MNAPKKYRVMFSVKSGLPDATLTKRAAVAKCRKHKCRAVLSLDGDIDGIVFADGTVRPLEEAVKVAQ